MTLPSLISSGTFLSSSSFLSVRTECGVVCYTLPRIKIRGARV